MSITRTRNEYDDIAQLIEQTRGKGMRRLRRRRQIRWAIKIVGAAAFAWWLLL